MDPIEKGLRRARMDLLEADGPERDAALGAAAVIDEVLAAMKEPCASDMAAQQSARGQVLSFGGEVDRERLGAIEIHGHREFALPGYEERLGWKHRRDDSASDCW